MIRRAKVRAIASFEFQAIVKRLSFVLATLGLPIALVALGTLPALVQWMVVKDDLLAAKSYGVVDAAGVLGEPANWGQLSSPLDDSARQAIEQLTGDEQVGEFAASGGVAFEPFPSVESAMAAFERQELEGFYAIARDYLDTGVVTSFVREVSLFDSATHRSADRNLTRLLRRRLLSDAVTDSRLATRIEAPATIETRSVGAGGVVQEVRHREIRTIAGFAIPLVMGMVLLIALGTTGAYLIQAVATEKENKVVEVLLASAYPEEILTGKLIGLGGAGLLQVFVWLGIVGVAGVMLAGLAASIGVEIPWAALPVAGLAFVLAYGFFGALMLATASLGNNAKEAQQYSMVWTLLASLPLMFFAAVTADPHGPLAVALTWIPVTAPMTVVLRLSVDPDGIAWWEVAGSFGVLLVSTWFALRFGARLFRVGLLLTGSRPGWREILRQARLTE